MNAIENSRGMLRFPPKIAVVGAGSIGMPAAALLESGDHA